MKHPSTHSLRLLLVDDESAALQTLRSALGSFPDIVIVAEARSVTEAEEALRHSPVDAIFLDIQMPMRSGFELLPLLLRPTPIIFTTAYDEYAIRAFELHAIDYLLKPVELRRLHNTIDRLRSQAHHQQPPQAHEQDEIVHLRANDGRIRTVHVRDIVYVKAEGNYTLAFLFGERSPITIRRTMSEWEQMLPKELFFRPHRSMIFNLSAISEFEPVSRGSAQIKLAGLDKSIDIGQKAAVWLRKFMKKGIVGSAKRVGRHPSDAGV